MAAFKISSCLIVFYCVVLFVDAAHVDVASSTTGPKDKPHHAEGFALASNSFGLDLYRQMAQQNDGHQPRDNILFSPYSISVVLSMVYQGAKGQTSEQLTQGLRLTTIPGVGSSSSSSSESKTTSGSEGGVYDVVGRAVRNVTDQLYQMDQSNQFDYGNVIIVDQSLKVRDEYTKNVREYYQGEVIPGDFQKDPQGIMNRVNQYVSNKTHGIIDPMLEQAPRTDSRLALVNGVYFKGQWAKKFPTEQTETGVFYGANGQQYQGVPYMKTQGQYPHTELEGLDADMVVIKYKGDDVSFVGVLPRNRDVDLSTIRQRLNATYIDEQIDRTTTKYVDSTVILPKWEVSTRYDLPETLEKMGIQDVFTSKSDLSGISDDQALHVSTAIHKAKMIVNEEGTEVGAGTYVEIAALSLPIDPPTFRFDRPFIYFIRHHQTGQILFIGEVHQF